MAFENMRYVIVQKSYSLIDFQKKSNTIPFLFHSKKEINPSEYEVCIAIGGNEYRYGFECVGNKILNEYLYKRKISKNKTTEKNIFKRNGQEVQPGSVSPNMKAEIEYCGSMCSDNSLLLADFGLREKNKELTDIYNWFVTIFVITDEGFLLDSYEQLTGVTLLESEVGKKIYNNIISLINEIDPCIKNIKIISKKDENGEDLYSIKAVHVYDGKKFEVPFKLESDGTKKFLLLSIFLATNLLFGTQCFVDELDSKLHPLLLRKIIKMFKDKNINKHGAQLVFSAHNIINLDSSDLRRDEIWFVEKNNQKSEIFSLYDFEDEDGAVRSDLSFGKHYLAGRFGAIPFQNEDGRK